MSAKADAVCLNVAFEDDDNHEGLLYTGETISAPLIQPSQWTLCGTPFQFSATVGPLPDYHTGLKERFQTITMMKFYSGKSTDELRLEDYQYLKKTGCSSTSPFFDSKIWTGRRIVQTHQAEKWFRSSVEVMFPSPMSTESTADSAEALPSHAFSLTPTIDFTSQSTAHPGDVFSESQATGLDKEPAQALTRSEGGQLMDSLLESVVKCMQIQNSLHRLVLFKLKQHATVTEAQADAVPGTEARSEKGTGQTVHYDPGALLCELKEPLEALMRCADIQRGLFQRMITVNLMFTEECSPSCENQESPEVTESQVNMLAVQSEVESITFKTKMVCNHARNPFTSQQLKASTTEDVIQHISDDKRPLSTLTVNSVTCSRRELPHGHGTLKTVAGKLLYSGNWRKGKRHGKGEGLIFSLSCNKSTTAEHGFYVGGWKNNARHGSGKMTFVSGAVYEGQWQYDKITGYGTFTFPDGTIQEGTWKDGSPDGCVLFTWPHGATEYREYEQGRGQLSSCKLDKETVGKVSQISCIRSQLLTIQGRTSELKDENLSLKDELNTLKTEHVEMSAKYQASLCEIRHTFNAQREQENKNLREEFEEKLKEAEKSDSKSAERIRELENELEESRGSQLCQICFEHPRDCIIMPCTHLLYCRTCVTAHKKKGDSRCPTCRGPICGEILCNVSH